MYLLNAIPGSIIPGEGCTMTFSPTTPESVPADIVSAIGHSDTAAVISSLLGRTIPAARVSVPVVNPGDIHFLALYQGPRLPEGATQLPEGATLAFYRMTVTSASALEQLEKDYWRANYYAR